MRIVLGIEYDGSNYHGWQTQAGITTVQETLEEALGAIANEPISVICAGRTDAGVHAFGQVVHFDTEAERSEHAWIFGSNSNLPHDICVRWAKQVPEDFHARFSATARQYRYLIYNHSIRPSLWRQRAVWHPRHLNEKRMQAAAKYLLGEHDFSSFRGIACQSKTPMREIFNITVERNENFIRLEVRANSFLHHMVRNIAGVLMAIGESKREPIWAQEVLQARDRTLAGVTAAPQGLYLMKVEYSEQYQLPQQTKNGFCG